MKSGRLTNSQDIFLIKKPVEFQQVFLLEIIFLIQII